MRIVLTGNPNSGKTTLFNGLTGSDARTGNYNGVTVTEKQASFMLNKNEVEVIDLPGLMSLDGYTLEEKRAADILKKGEYDVLVQVVEAANIKSALRLTNDLAKLKKPTIIYINMYSELEKDGGAINIKELESAVQTTVLNGEAITKQGIKLLKNALLSKGYNQLAAIDYEKLIPILFSIGNYTISKFDKLLITPKFAVVTFIALMIAVFYLSFGNYGIGSIVGNYLAEKTNEFAIFVKVLLTDLGQSKLIVGLISDGIIGGLGSVLTFLPQLLMLEASLITLEQTGIISRLSFLCDGTLSKVGLNGRAIFSLLSGFGCTALAAADTGGLENELVKKRVVRVLPMLSCSAKTPVYLFIAAVAFPKAAFIAVLSVYISSIVYVFIFSYIAAKLSKAPAEPMILELPRLRGLNAVNTLKPLKKCLKQFIIKIGTVVLMVSVIVYLLKSVTTDFQFASSSEIENSILAFLGGKLSFLFRPLGFNGWQIPTAILSGLFAKEAIISTLFLAYPNGLEMSISSGAALITFIMLYTPCVTALASISREAGIQTAILTAIYQLAQALFSAYVTYFIFEKRLVVQFSLAVVLIVVALIIVNRLLKGRNLNEKLSSKNKRKVIAPAVKRVRR